VDNVPHWLFDLIAGLIGLSIVGVILAWLQDVWSQRKAHGQTTDEES
jgi:hypothetical protein